MSIQPTIAVLEAIAKAEREGRVSEPGPRLTEDEFNAANDLGIGGMGRQAKPRKAKAAVKLVAPLFVCTGPRSFVFVVPLKVVPGDNFGGGMSKRRIGRAGHERTACTRVFARGHSGWAVLCDALHNGCKIEITLTRLGGRGLDRINVEAAMKYVADTVAAWLGVDDNNPRLVWNPCQQQTKGPSGVRIELRVS